jgi:hypothetical protein
MLIANLDPSHPTYNKGTEKKTFSNTEKKKLRGQQKYTLAYMKAATQLDPWALAT